MVLYNINHTDYCQMNVSAVYELDRGDWLNLEKLFICKHKSTKCIVNSLAIKNASNLL